MPVLEVWYAKEVNVFKRSMGTDNAGVQKPLFFREDSRILFGDAMDTLIDIIRSFDR